MVVDAPRICFKVSPWLNLYYSLEVGAGSYVYILSQEYAEIMKTVFPQDLRKRFVEIHEPQRFSWRIKSSLFNGISKIKMEESLTNLAKEHYFILKEAYRYYESYWKGVSPILEEVAGHLETVRLDLEALLEEASAVTLIPWKVEELDIFILDAPTGEPVGNQAIGYGTRIGVPFFHLILHEATHMLVEHKVCDIAQKYTNEWHASYIDEAVNNLLSNTIFSSFEPTRIEKMKEVDNEIRKLVPSISMEKFIEQHEKRQKYLTYYRKLLQEDWQTLVKERKNLEQMVSILLEKHKAEIKSD